MTRTSKESRSNPGRRHNDSDEPLRVLLIGDFPTDLTRPRGGVESVALTIAEMPQHKHTLSGASDASDESTAKDNYLSTSTKDVYKGYDSATSVTMAADTLAHTGGGEEHNNMQPFLTVTFCIAVAGMFPSRN